MWWLNTDQNWKGISPKVYYAAGFGGNYIVIDKEHDLLLVFNWIDDSKIAEALRLIIKSIE
jgi:hypothetical protein